MECLEIDNRVTINKWKEHPQGGPTLARWSINGGAGQITLNVMALWGISVDLNVFATELIFSYLIEHLCIERAHERIRISGGRCKPCCVLPIARMMLDHVGTPEMN